MISIKMLQQQTNGKSCRRISMLILGIMLTIASTNSANAQIVGDSITGAFTTDSANSAFDPTAISGSAVIIDPGEEFRGEAFSLGSATVDAYVDISPTELLFGLVRTDDASSSSDFAAGSAAVRTLTLTDIASASNPIELEFIEAIGSNNSSWGDAPGNYVVNTTADSIEILMTGGFILREGGELTLRYAFVTVPEPGSTGLLLLAAGGWLAPRRRR